MALLYDHWIGAEESFTKKQAAAGSYGPQVRRIAAFFPGKDPADIRVLDFGMGWGFWLLAAKERGHPVTGVDLSAERRSFAADRGVEAAVSSSDLAGRTFDFINAEAVFEHIPAPLSVLREVTGLLAPGGVMRIAVPDGRRVVSELAAPDWVPSKDAVHPLEHINCFTHRALVSFGAAAGLAPIRQPWHGPGIDGAKEIARGAAAGAYRTFFGTTLHFRKPR